MLMASARPMSPAQQAVLQAASDLEECLKAITPSARDHQGLKKLTELHEGKFTDLPAVIEARMIRNWIIHREREVAADQADRAAGSFRLAIGDILPYCPPDLQRRFDGAARFQPEPPSPPTAPGAPPATPLSAAATDMRAEPRPRSPVVWYIFAAAFLIVAAFAYIARPAHQGSGTTTAAPPSAPTSQPQATPVVPDPHHPSPAP